MCKRTLEIYQVLLKMTTKYYLFLGFKTVSILILKFQTVQFWTIQLEMRQYKRPNDQKPLFTSRRNGKEKLGWKEFKPELRNLTQEQYGSEY